YGHNRRAPMLTVQPEVTHLSTALMSGGTFSNSTFTGSESERTRLEDHLAPEEWNETTCPTSPCPKSLSAGIDDENAKLNPAFDRDINSSSALSSSKTRRVEDYLYLFATRPTFKATDSPMSILCKIVNLQTQLPYSPLDPLKTFLNSHWFFDYIIAQCKLRID
ncbi:unnamed protein product, partial [Rhizoctonia solani]